MPDAGVLPDADTPAPPDRDTAGFRLAVFGAVLIVVLFAGYGVGRLSQSMPGDTASAAGQPAADAHGHDAAGGDATGETAAGPGAAAHDDTGTAPHTHHSDGTVTPAGGAAAGGLRHHLP